MVTADSVYKRLISQERNSPNPNDMLRIRVSNDSPEGNALKRAGVSLREDQLRRGDLLQTGFVFHNKIGGGEKPILSADVSVGGQRLNLSQRVLLTQAELNAVLTYQQSRSNEYGLRGKDREIVRRDMIGFLTKAYQLATHEKALQASAFKAALASFEKGHPLYSDNKRDQIYDFLKKTDEKFKGFGLGFLVQACVQNIELLKVRGAPVEVYGTRLTILRGVPSPFLDSGLQFDINYDATIYPDDKCRTRRLNMVVVHLLSRDLSEMGVSINGSHDQTYIKPAEYIEQFFGKGQPEETKSSLFDRIRGKSKDEVPMPELSLEDKNSIIQMLLARVERGEF